MSDSGKPAAPPSPAPVPITVKVPVGTMNVPLPPRGR